MKYLDNLDKAEVLEPLELVRVQGTTYPCFGDETCFCDDEIKANYFAENTAYNKKEKMDKVYEIN